jgi:hypothetical protein
MERFSHVGGLRVSENFPGGRASKHPQAFQRRITPPGNATSSSPETSEVHGIDDPLGAVNSTNGLVTGLPTPDKHRFHLSKLAFEIFSCLQNAPRDRPLCSHRLKISRHSDSLRRTLPFKDICIPFLRFWGNGQVYFDKSETGMTPIIGRLPAKWFPAHS